MSYTALLLRDQMTQHILSRTDTEHKTMQSTAFKQTPSVYGENFITHHETSITVNYALSITGQLFAHHKYIPMLHTNKKKKRQKKKKTMDRVARAVCL